MAFNLGAGRERWDWGYAIWDVKRLVEWKAPLLATPMLEYEEGAEEDAVEES